MQNNWRSIQSIQNTSLSTLSLFILFNFLSIRGRVTFVSSSSFRRNFAEVGFQAGFQVARSRRRHSPCFGVGRASHDPSCPPWSSLSKKLEINHQLPFILKMCFGQKSPSLLALKPIPDNCEQAHLQALGPDKDAPLRRAAEIANALNSAVVLPLHLKSRNPDENGKGQKAK